MRYPITLILAGICLISIHGFGQEMGDPNSSLDSSSSKALSQTQNLLTDPSARAKAIKGDGQAESADSYVNNLTGGNAQTNNDVYDLASEVFANVVKDAHGDPKKMQAEMEEFQRDPAAFAAKWTPEERAKLKALSLKMPATAAPQE